METMAGGAVWDTIAGWISPAILMTAKHSAKPDDRAVLLGEWVRSLRPGASLSPLAGDASFRRYFRVQAANGESLVAMDAPPPNEDTAQLVAAREALAGRVSVPVVHASDPQNGFALLEDFGDQTYARAFAESDSAGTAKALYDDAVAALVRLQSPPILDLPRYDEAFLRRETGLFPEWYCRRRNSRALDKPGRTAILQRAESFLVSEIVRMPHGAMHRDYHSRNLMVLPAGRNPGALDFQGAVVGPATYDLASLARDAYVPHDEARCGRILESYWLAAREHGLRPAESPESLRRDFNIVSVQRGLKVMGIFCRLALRDGKRDFLADLPTVRANAMAACEQVGELRELGRMLAEIPAPGEK